MWVFGLSVFISAYQGRAETFGGAGAQRGTWNTAVNRAVLLADMCIEMDASVLIQQQMP